PVAYAVIAVPAELFDAEPVRVRRSRAATAGDQNQVLILRPSVGEHWREDRHGYEDRDQEHAEDRAGVAVEPQKRVVPESAARPFAAEFLGFDFGDAHEYRIRG